MDVTSYLLGKKSGGGGPTPTGTINITENGTHDVTNYATANVNVSGGTDTRWQQIGYDEEPDAIQNGIDYAKQIMQNWDASVSDRGSFFKSNYNLVYFPTVDTSNITKANNMFELCKSLQSVGDFDFSTITNTSSSGGMFKMFCECYSLGSVGNVNTSSKKVFMNNMFQDCQNLKTINSITLNDNCSYVFNRCYSLETIGEINTLTTTNSNSIFGKSCPNLSNNTLKVVLNYLKRLTTQSSDYKNLSAIGLTQAQAELCATFDEWADLENAGWTTGY